VPKQKHKKTFNCDGVNHRGFGQYCHRCEEADRLQEFVVKGTMTKYVRNKDTGKKEQQSFKLDDKSTEKLNERIKQLRSA